MAMSIDARGSNRAYYIAMQTLQERQKLKAEGLQVRPRPTRIRIERPATGTPLTENASPVSQNQAITVFESNVGPAPETTS